MTDNEIIQAFLTNDQRGIREAYMAWREPFWASVHQRTNLDELYRDDAYQEAFIRLQQHILTGRLTADNIQTAVLAYLKELGYYVALELIRGRRELPESYLHPDADDDCEHEQAATDPDDAPDAPESGFYDPMEHYLQEEKERLIRDQVMLMGKPCAPLLVGFYWGEKSMDTLALELGYANADSAKAQKAKCMKKLKNFVGQKLREYGYAE